MNRTANITVGFAAAPIVATVIVWLYVAVTSGAPPIGFTLNVGVIAFGVAAILGVPAYLLTRSWRLKSMLSVGLVGAVVGLLPAVLLAQVSRDLQLPLITVFSSAVAGAVFSVIAGRESNNRIERTRER